MLSQGGSSLYFDALADGIVSKVTIVPFYDRFGLYRLILQFLPKKILPVLTRLENWLVILLVRS